MRRHTKMTHATTHDTMTEPTTDEDQAAGHRGARLAEAGRRLVGRPARRALSLVAAGALAAALLVAGQVATNPAPAQALSGSSFNPGNIISDQVFSNSGSMTASQVQSFLNTQGASCTTTSSYTCLKDYHQTTTALPDANQHCSPYQGASNESAATIIVKVAKACDINPQVILVTLQKEEGLVTMANSAAKPSGAAGRYQIAMGFGCPDSAPCNTQYYGFFNQVFQAARQFDVYRTNQGLYGFRAAGQTYNVLYSPTSSCGSAPVTMANWATAGLYDYTPYQPNAAALANLYGAGNSCSSYGNRNFWVYFNQWFGSTQVQETNVNMTVTNSSGQPMSGVAVAFYKASASTTTVSKPALTTTTSSTGTASALLQKGSYKAAFVASDGTTISGAPGISDLPYMTTWAGGTTSAAGAKVITAGSSASTALPVTVATWQAPTNSPFKDVTSSTQFYSQIAWLSTAGISEGYANGTYQPGTTVKRNAMAAFLYRMAGSPAYTPPKTSPFKDVSTTNQFYQQIAWLASQGISTGYADGDFKPDATVDRNAMAAFLYRFAGSPTFTAPTQSSFKDVTPTTQFYDEISWMDSTGISQGYADGDYKPDASIKRNAMAAFLYRFNSLGL
ncbi:MAG TPA: S-layer homology domain-containing protein [Microbacteriaceae bacterium]|nr:S-layer homology domain-containing protein [Microbacteriaceae bacterium]